jgi:hypothetical protein
LNWFGFGERLLIFFVDIWIILIYNILNGGSFILTGWKIHRKPTVSGKEGNGSELLLLLPVFYVITIMDGDFLFNGKGVIE